MGEDVDQVERLRALVDAVEQIVFPLVSLAHFHNLGFGIEQLDQQVLVRVLLLLLHLLLFLLCLFRLWLLELVRVFLLDLNDHVLQGFVQFLETDFLVSVVLLQEGFQDDQFE